MRITVFSLFFMTVTMSALITPISGASAQQKNSPLGSILDPDDSERIKREAKPDDTNKAFMLDQEFPELPEVLRWELALTSKAFKVNDNLRTRSDLLTAASKAIEFLCMENLQADPSDEPACSKLLSTVELLDPDSPIARCLRAGFETEVCANAYRTQTTVSEMPRGLMTAYFASKGQKYIPSSFENDLSVKLEQEKYRKSINQARSEYNATPSLDKKNKKYDEIEKKKTDLLNKYLQLSCSTYRLVALPAKVVTTYNSSQPTPRPKSGAPAGKTLEEMLERGPFKEAKLPSRDELPKNHFRVMDAECLRAIDWVVSKNSSLPIIPCKKEGISAPNCIAARRALPGQRKGASTVGAEGIERF